MTEQDPDVWSPARMEQRIVRYPSLRPCFNAFIDTRTPGSEAKENFTIIGPGVSENPSQHVHIAEPHGFNIGGARQPPNCVNSQHSHETAEVFLAHSGRWRFDLGEFGDDAQVELGPGDVISLPTKVFRGFTNVGDETGFLWAILGEDDPGRVTWAPHVFDLAEKYGLMLLESGRLIDVRAGEGAPHGARKMLPPSRDEVAAMARLTAGDAAKLVVRAPRLTGGETTVIGAGAPLSWPHGFTLTRLRLERRDDIAQHRRATAEVVFVHEGVLTVRWPDGATALEAGDTMTVPAGPARSYESEGGATAFFVRKGDRVEPAQVAVDGDIGRETGSRTGAQRKGG